MESASSGAEQFMFRTGQLREEFNIFWSSEFVNYHGLKSVSDIPFVSVDTVTCQRFNQSQLGHYQSLIKYLKPLMRDTISFQLISMIMLLDTSNITDGDDLVSKTPGRSSVLLPMCREVPENNKALIQERFQGIKVLQKHYAHLFHNRCIQRKNEDLKGWGDTEEELNKTIKSIMHIAYYISLLLQ